ncbi:hypothetical protein ASG37_06940 [Sphingomonas sp. Leaf407]|nr:hypothetical protein ASE97_04230 [Sphingomonas sp. Leaf42]KQT28591.1 hypothetical protein ASG37_06940 [Sphingomonas sp. Leaf407]
MAFLDLARDLPRSALADVAIPPRSATVPLVAPIERQVILAARGDSRRSLRAPGRIDRALGWLFGWKPANRLADPRLEALRRYVVMARLRGDRLPIEETARLIAAGFVRGAIDEIRRMVPVRSAC